nr:ROK family transcriptional regulator [Wenjunlia tyrosinilytica]
MRQQNLSLVLRTVADQGPLSRARVAAHTGLTRAAVSSLVEELRGADLLVESGPEPGGRVGRPGSALAVSDRGAAGLGLEVGVEHLGACVVDLRGEARVWSRTAAANRGRAAAQVLADLAAVADEVVRQASGQGLRPVAAVLAVPGLVGSAPGTVEHAPNLGWRHEAVVPLWPGTLPVEVENEANLGALAELWSRSVGPDFVHVSAEAGIGAALVIDGRLFRGARGFAGELGHVPVRPDGPPCACGARGCLETYAGEAAVLRRAGLEGVAMDPVGALGERARAGDARVVAALERAATAMGTALAGAVNLVDPAAVVLGGAYAELGEWLMPGIRRELERRVTVRPWQADALRVSAHGRRGPLLGAGLTTVRRILDNPGRFTLP